MKSGPRTYTQTDLIMAKHRQCHGVVLQISALLAGVTVGVADLSIQKCTGGLTQQWTLESGVLKSSTYVYPRSISLSGQWALQSGPTPFTVGWPMCTYVPERGGVSWVYM
jgi:hypothetical protein